jgi:dTDP-L-rhamnose 4-epimerase
MERHSADGLALNVASGEPVNVREVASILAVLLGTEIDPEITGKYRAGDIRHCFADISAARKFLGYESKVKFSDGIRELVNWLREQRAEDRAAEAVQKLAVYGLTA